MTRRAMVLLLSALALMALTACGGDNKVGNKALLDFKEQANNRLGETTTTAAAVTTTTAAGARAAATTTTKPKGSAAAAAATTATARSAGAPPASTATTAAAATQTVREIDIYGDNDPNHEALDPKVQTAYVGSVIRWVNKDTVPRSVRADSGQFASPMIQPGAHWDYTAGTVGIFSYGDDTRPYVTGELRVSKP